MKGRKALQTAGEGSVIKIIGQPGCLHFVWRDRRDGLKRICRPSMLETTYSAEEKEWEIVGDGADRVNTFEAIATGLGLAACKHCIKWSGLN